MSLAALVVATTCAACSSKKTATAVPPSNPSQQAIAAASAPVTPPPPSTVDAGIGDAMPDVGAPKPAPLLGTDFEAQAKEIYRVAACGGDGPVPPEVRRRNGGCALQRLRAMYEEYKTNWVKVAMPYIAALVPKDIPTTIVYPSAAATC